MAEAEGLRAGIFIGGKGRFAGEIFLAACSVTQAPRYLAVTCSVLRRWRTVRSHLSPG